MALPTLWQFKRSHYSEKVRWALDLKSVAHRRISLYPGWHVARTRLVSGQQAVPIFRDDTATLFDSTRIIAHVERHHVGPPLYPDDPNERRRALELEEFFDEQLGTHLIRAFYFLLFQSFDSSVAFFAQQSSGVVFQLYRATFPAVRAGARRYLSLYPEAVGQSRQVVESTLQQFEKEIQPSGYLVGRSFSVADLTVASLLSTFLSPPGSPYPCPVPLPDVVLEYRESLEKLEALSWVREIYAKHRPNSSEVV